MDGNPADDADYPSDDDDDYHCALVRRIYEAIKDKTDIFDRPTSYQVTRLDEMGEGVEDLAWKILEQVKATHRGDLGFFNWRPAPHKDWLYTTFPSFTARLDAVIETLTVRCRFLSQVGTSFANQETLQVSKGSAQNLTVMDPLARLAAAPIKVAKVKNHTQKHPIQVTDALCRASPRTRKSTTTGGQP
jgi:hypothetical protein